jgi:hypothetical protein
MQWEHPMTKHCGTVERDSVPEAQNGTKEFLMTHRFNIGQIVELEPHSFRSAVLGPYEIRHLIPASDRDPGDPCYRIKSGAEKYERVAPESELTLSKGVFA